MRSSQQLWRQQQQQLLLHQYVHGDDADFPTPLAEIQQQQHDHDHDDYQRSIPVMIANTTTTTTAPSASSLSDSSIFPNQQDEQQKQKEKLEFLLRFGAVGRLYSRGSKNSSNSNNQVQNKGGPTTTTTISNNDDDDDDDDDPTRQSSVLVSPSYDNILHRLVTSHVVIVGLGGVGSWAAEALVRSGIGHITLVDLDDICISNTNRQLHTTIHTIGQFKIDALYQRLHSINPQCHIHLIHDFVSTDNVANILLQFQSSSQLSSSSTTTTSPKQEKIIYPKITVCLDAIDHTPSKTALIAACTDLHIPIVTCGGSAGKTDPTRFVVHDLTMVQGDPLLGTCRKQLRKDYGFPSGVAVTSNTSKRLPPKLWNILAVYSKEPTKTPNYRTSSDINNEEGGMDKTDDDNNYSNNNRMLSSFSSSSWRQCDGVLGTACFVTGTSGFVAAGKIVEMIATDTLLVPQRPQPSSSPLP